jgi:broad specificity phosphatase PhoE
MAATAFDATIGSDATLLRLSMVRAGPTDIARDGQLLGSMETQLSAAGCRAVEALRHHWEWAERVLSSPLRRARQTASLLAGDAEVRLEPALRARSLGPWEGRPPRELHAALPETYERWRAGDGDLELVGAESADVFQTRVARLVARLLEGGDRSLLLVSHLEVIRAIARQLGAPLPAARPWPAEMVLLTRREGGRFRLGRRTSDPEPLRTPFEWSGLSGSAEGREPERHVAPLTIRR